MGPFFEPSSCKALAVGILSWEKMKVCWECQLRELWGQLGAGLACPAEDTAAGPLTAE